MKSLNQPMGTATSMAFVAAAIALMFALLLACDYCYLGDIPMTDSCASRRTTASGEIPPAEAPFEVPAPAALFDTQDWWTSGLPLPAPHRSAPTPPSVDFFPCDFLFSLLQ
jgi:hypothetical protein